MGDVVKENKSYTTHKCQLRKFIIVDEVVVSTYKVVVVEDTDNEDGIDSNISMTINKRIKGMNTVKFAMMKINKPKEAVVKKSITIKRKRFDHLEGLGPKTFTNTPV